MQGKGGKGWTPTSKGKSATLFFRVYAIIFSSFTLYTVISFDFLPFPFGVSSIERCGFR